MAVLSVTDRARTLAQLLRDAAVMQTGAHSKPSLRAALDAADAWVDANAASFNTALPQPFRGAASPQEKAAILAYVCLRRGGMLKAQED